MSSSPQGAPNAPEYPAVHGYPAAAPAQPYGQDPVPPAYAPIPPARPERPGKAVSIVGIVLGGLALLLSWVPIINNLAAVLALVGLVLGVVGLVLAIRRRGPKALSIVALVLSGLSVVIVVATQAFYGAVLDEVSDSLDEAAGTPVVSTPQAAAPAAVEADATDASAADEPSSEAPAAQGAAPADGLALGEPGTVGRYTVTVEAVDLDATDAVVAANTFNEAPENGRYATADLAVTYEDGNREGMPLFDLDVELLGGDQRNYATYECMASLGDLSEQTDGLRAGGSSSFRVCFDIPDAAAQGASVRVGDQLDFGSDPVVWAVP
jgi:hypothetical protein